MNDWRYLWPAQPKANRFLDSSLNSPKVIWFIHLFGRFSIFADVNCSIKIGQPSRNPRFGSVEMALPWVNNEKYQQNNPIEIFFTFTVTFWDSSRAVITAEPGLFSLLKIFHDQAWHLYYFYTISFKVRHRGSCTKISSGTKLQAYIRHFFKGLGHSWEKLDKCLILRSNIRV